MSKLILVLGIAAIISGCEYVPRTIYEIQTTDGRIIKLLCPAINPDRSRITYIIGGKCVVVKDTKDEVDHE